jgi:hypothetical protein
MNIMFGMDYTELELVFWYSLGTTETKQEMIRIDTLDMTGHDFVGPAIGVYAVSDKQEKVRYLDLVVM